MLLTGRWLTGLFVGFARRRGEGPGAGSGLGRFVQAEL